MTTPPGNPKYIAKLQYRKYYFCLVCTAYSSWNSPSGWSEPDPVVYRSFDCSHRLNMMEGTEQADFLSFKDRYPSVLIIDLTIGLFNNSKVVIFIHLVQIKGAISLYHARKQWVDLEILKEACITNPETCGAAAGSVAFWMRRKLADHISRGIISSQGPNGTGFRIYTRDSKLR